MIVDEKDIDTTVLELFFKFGIQPDGRLAYEALKEEWPQYLLRTNDLNAGIRRLMELGDLRLEQDGDQTFIVLSRQGFARGKSSGAGRDPGKTVWMRLRDTLWLEFRPYLHAADHRGAQRRANDL